jgi:rhamnulokinase
VTAHFLAFDLGAESGRAMVGTLERGVLDVRELHRFANEPVRQNGALFWDILHLWQEMRRALEQNGRRRLESIGVDSWGVDYALIGETGNLLENPYHYRDSRTTGVMEAVFERVSRDRIYTITGIQFLPINTIYQLYAACRATPDLIDAARHHSRPAELLAVGRTGVRVHRSDDHPVHRRADANVGDEAARRHRSADAAAPAAGGTWRDHRRTAVERLGRIVRHTGGGSRLP